MSKSRLPKKSGACPKTSLGFEDGYIEGYLVGKIEVYCEQVRTGAKLVGALGFDRKYLPLVRRTVKAEECRLIVDGSYAQGRATAYIYRYAFAKLIVKSLLDRSGKPSVTAIWSTGKLFGYSDYEIARYLETHRVKTAL